MDYVEIAPEPDLLAQVISELLELAADPDYVRTGHGESGMVLTVPAELAEVWYQAHLRRTAAAEEGAAKAEEASVPEAEDPIVEVVDEQSPPPPSSAAEQAPPPPSPTQGAGAAPVPEATPSVVVPASLAVVTKRGPGRPRKVTSASVSEAL